MNRSAEHPLGSFQNASHRAERMLGAPIARFMARGQVRWTRGLPMRWFSLGSR